MIISLASSKERHFWLGSKQPPCQSRHNISYQIKNRKRNQEMNAASKERKGREKENGNLLSHI